MKTLTKTALIALVVLTGALGTASAQDNENQGATSIAQIVEESRRGSECGWEALNQDGAADNNAECTVDPIWQDSSTYEDFGDWGEVDCYAFIPACGYSLEELEAHYGRKWIDDYTPTDTSISSTYVPYENPVDSHQAFINSIWE